MTGDWSSIAQPMLAFAGFLVLALLVRQGDRPGASWPLKAFIVYAITVSTYVGFSENDMWPFAAWRYVPYAIGDAGGFGKLVGVDESGREIPLDTRTLEPLEFAEVINDLDWPTKGIPHVNEMLSYILVRAQDGLARAHEGKPVGNFNRLLGRFSAPVFHVAVTPWNDREHLPQRIEELRLYAVYWRVSGDAAHVEKKELITSVKP
jgi:hypothetical protein